MIPAEKVLSGCEAESVDNDLITLVDGSHHFYHLICQFVQAETRSWSYLVTHEYLYLTAFIYAASIRISCLTP